MDRELTQVTAITCPPAPAAPEGGSLSTGAASGDRGGAHVWTHALGGWAAQRRRSVIGWAVLVVAFVVCVGVIGPPLSADTVSLWLTAALFVPSLGDVGRWRRGVSRDWLPLCAVLGIYALLRGY